MIGEADRHPSPWTRSGEERIRTDFEPERLCRMHR